MCFGLHVCIPSACFWESLQFISRRHVGAWVAHIRALDPRPLRGPTEASQYASVRRDPPLPLAPAPSIWNSSFSTPGITGWGISACLCERDHAATHHERHFCHWSYSRHIRVLSFQCAWKAVHQQGAAFLQLILGWWGIKLFKDDSERHFCSC